jgi:hypothetical protein
MTSLEYDGDTFHLCPVCARSDPYVQASEQLATAQRALNALRDTWRQERHSYKIASERRRRGDRAGWSRFVNESMASRRTLARMILAARHAVASARALKAAYAAPVA